MYEVRGVSHSGGERYPDGKNRDIQILDLSRFMDGVIDLLDNWVEKGIEPPATKSDDAGVGADAPAVDLPETACPLGKYYPFPQFRGTRGAGSTGFAAYDGTSLEPLDGQLMFVDMNTSLSDDLLPMTDRMTMGVSLEGRLPFLDYRLNHARNHPALLSCPARTLERGERHPTMRPAPYRPSYYHSRQGLRVGCRLFAGRGRAVES